MSSSVQSYRKYSQAVKNPSINEQSIQSLNEKIDTLNTNLNNFEAKFNQIIDKTRNVVSLGRPKQNAQPGMFDVNHPIAG